MEEINLIDANPKHSRFKSLPWYSKNKSNIVVGGCGGIGSWVALLLARQGEVLDVCDFDTVEEHNLGGQFFNENQIGVSKTEAAEENILSFTDNDDCNFYNSSFEESSLASNIMISCFDSMDARKKFFNVWKKHNKNNNEAIFIDGRLLAEDFQIYCVTINTIEEYEKTLFDDKDIPDEECSAKSTTHCSVMIASLMTSLFNNHISNMYSKDSLREVPFSLSVNLSLLMFEINNL